MVTLRRVRPARARTSLSRFLVSDHHGILLLLLLLLLLLGLLVLTCDIGMVSTLVPVLVMSGVYIIIFLLIRYNQKRFYAPRTYLGSLRENERSPELPKGLFNWIGSFWKMPDAYALQHQSLDAYLFLRYLRICTTICFVSLCITWPILFPVNATGGNGLSQLEILSYSNVNVDKNGTRLFAHALVAWVVYGMVIYMITRECIFFINLRQAYLLTPQYAKRISSRTVLFTAVPDEFLNGDRLRQVFGADAVKNVWVAGLTKDLDDAVEERDKVAMTLEKGEIKLLKAVNKARIAAAKKDKSGAAPDVARDTEHGSLASRWITDKMRPTHRTGKFGLIGKKVDTVEWGRTELHTLVPKVEAMQAEFAAGKYEKVNSVFVEFYTQSDAQAAAQVVTHHHALHMSPRFIGVKPDEVVWKNLSISWWQKVIRRYLAVLFIALLVIFWAIPVGIVGIIAQVNTLKSLPGLTWIGDIPPVRTIPNFPRHISQWLFTDILLSGYSRCRLRSFALGGPLHLDELGSHHYACSGQVRRRGFAVPRRTLYAKRLLHFPDCPGVPHPHADRYCLDGDYQHRPGPQQHLWHTWRGHPDVVQLLHLLLHRPGSEHRY